MSWVVKRPSGRTLFIVLILLALAHANPARAASDTSGPVLQSMVISPSTIDTSSSNQTVKTRVHVTDDLSGVGTPTINFSGPGGQFLAGSGQRVSGTDTDAIYDISVIVPRYAQRGTWTVGALALKDPAGNQRSYYPTQLTAAGYPTTFEQTGADDTSGPVLQSMVISPSTIDTSSSNQTVKTRVHVTDDLSGVGTPTINFSGPGGQFLAGSGQRVSGTDTDAIYDISVIVPRYAQRGTWTVGALALKDPAGNQRSYYPTQLTAAGYPTTFEQTGADDTSGPVLQSMVISPSTIDTSSSNQTVKTRVHVTDDLSGVGTPTINFSGPGGQFLAGSGQRVSGTDTDAIYDISVIVPRYAQRGTWTVGALALKDPAGNQRSYYPTQLTAAGYPTTFDVADDGVTPVTTIDTHPPNPGGGSAAFTFHSSKTGDTFECPARHQRVAAVRLRADLRRPDSWPAHVLGSRRRRHRRHRPLPPVLHVERRPHSAGDHHRHQAEEPGYHEQRRVRIPREQAQLDLRVQPRRRRLADLLEWQELQRPRRRRPHLPSTRHGPARQSRSHAAAVRVDYRHHPAYHHDRCGAVRPERHGRGGVHLPLERHRFDVPMQP